jgi:hypothetical protein
MAQLEAIRNQPKTTMQFDRSPDRIGVVQLRRLAQIQRLRDFQAALVRIGPNLRESAPILREFRLRQVSGICVNLRPSRSLCVNLR